MTKVKICGITRREDAQAAIGAGADYLGLIFAPSPRQITPEKAKALMEGLPEFSGWVGVFVNESPEKIASIARQLKLHHVQLHGEESPKECALLGQQGLQVIKALRVKDRQSILPSADFPTPYLLLDTYSENRQGGTGNSFDWKLLDLVSFQHKLFISGGLNPDSVGKLLAHYSPFAVDVSSGVEESPGIKDETKISKFMQSVREARHA